MTANADMATICQIGIVKCRNGVFVDEWKSLINPEAYFDRINVSIRGIDESAVEGAPTFSEINDTLISYLENEVVVCHTRFDRVSIVRLMHSHPWVTKMLSCHSYPGGRG